MSQKQQWEQWQLKGNIPQAYERYLVPAIFAPWAEKLVELAGLKPGERVLDAACGTGIVARLAAQRVGPAGKVVGLDLNPEMLGVARTWSLNLSPAIEWQEGSIADMPLPEAAFEVVLCQQGLQYFANRQATQEMQRVLGPGGRLVVSVWRPIQYSPGYAALAQALERHVGSEAARIMQAPFALGEAGELRSLIAGGGFREVRIYIDSGLVRFPSPEECVWRQVASSPLAGPVSQVAEEARAALLSDFRAALHLYIDDDGLVFPIEAHVAIAYK